MNRSLVAFFICFASLLAVCGAEHYPESYVETNNPVRIFDWDTLNLLIAKRAKVAVIKAKTPDELIEQLQKLVAKIDGAEKIRFRFKREMWEQPLSDGTVGVIRVGVDLDLKNIDLLNLLRYVSEQNKMTFSVLKGEIVFRPVFG